MLYLTAKMTSEDYELTSKKKFFPGESATHYLVKNTVRTFKELGVRVCLSYISNF